jgi:hypothetical protein
VRTIAGETHLICSLDGSVRYDNEVSSDFATAIDRYSDDASTVCMNLSNGATSRYSNWHFTSHAKFGDEYYGMDSTGLRLLEGNTDEFVPIVAALEVGNVGMADMQICSPEFIYVSGKSSSPLVIDIWLPDGTVYSYPVPIVQRRHQGAATRRIQRADEQAAVAVRCRYPKRRRVLNGGCCRASAARRVSQENLMASDEDDDDNWPTSGKQFALPQRDETDFGKAQERGMSLVGLGDFGKIRTVEWEGPSGWTSVHRLRTRGGWPVFEEDVVEPGEPLSPRGFVAKVHNGRAILFNPYTLDILITPYLPAVNEYTVLDFATDWNVPPTDTTGWNDVVLFNGQEIRINNLAMPSLGITADHGYLAVPYLINRNDNSDQYGNAIRNETEKRVFADRQGEGYDMGRRRGNGHP